MIDQWRTIALRTASFLAAPPTPPPGKGAEWGKAAPIGLLVILLLCVAVWLLLRSMSKHLRKVREFGEQERAERDAAAASGTPRHVAGDAAGPGGTNHPGPASATIGAPDDPGTASGPSRRDGTDE